MRTIRKIVEIQEFVHGLKWSVLAVGFVVGCGGPTADPESLGELSQALNVCNETVPADRHVDGLPAFEQCETTTGAIWSNNGVDTSATSQGDGWVKTQQGGGYQCTEWAWRYMHFKWGVDYRSGNAGSWCDGQLPATLTKTTVPVHGDLIVFAPGSCGADSTTGHIAVVDVVNTASSSVTLVEQNSAGRRNSKISCALCFLHAVANDGSPSGGAGGAGGASSGGAGGSPTTAGSAGVSAGGGVSNSGGSQGAAGGSGAAVGGSAPVGSSGAPSTSGGAGQAGAPSGGTVAASGAGSSSGGPAAGASAPDYDAEQDAGCSMGPGTPPRTALFPYALLLAGWVARRSMLRRKAEPRSE